MLSHRLRTHPVLAVVFIGLTGAWDAASAQPTPPPLPKHDVTVLGGWGAIHNLDERDYDAWDGVAVAAIEVGRYWTDHLKTEVQVQTTTEALIFENSRQPTVVPGVPNPVFRYAELRVKVSGAAAHVQYQFFRNQWIHPFLGIGVSVDGDRLRREYPEQAVPIGQFGTGPFVYLGREVTPARTEWTARPSLSGGLKMYVARRAFFRSDAAVTVATGSRRTFRWQLGAGVDF